MERERDEERERKREGRESETEGDREREGERGGRVRKQGAKVTCVLYISPTTRDLSCSERRNEVI